MRNISRAGMLSLLGSLSPCLLVWLHAGDWPRFLGPHATSVSDEKGIITPWPRQGLRLVWHQKLGTGYGAPSIQNGKLYVFDRVVEKVPLDGKLYLRETKQARLSCLDARTGKALGDFTYPTAYKDSYGRSIRRRSLASYRTSSASVAPRSSTATS
jgi:hypothetical protein